MAEPRGPGARKALRGKIGLMNTDTIAIIVAILGVGLGLWRAIATMRQDVTTLRQEVRGDISALRQEVRADISALRQEMRAEIAAINNRIDNLYQALFSRKDPAA